MNIGKRVWQQELPALLKFAGPICVTQIAALGMGMTDVIVAGNAGTNDLAGVMIGTNAWHIVTFFFFGIGLANAPIVGRHFGVRDWAAIRDQLHQSVWLALACGASTAVFVFLVARLIYLWNIEPEVSEIAVNYLYAVIPGAIAIAVMPLFRTSLEAMEQLNFVMKVSVAAFFLNILMDLWFVFGGFGMPAMGGAGCGAATSVVLVTQLVVFLVYLMKSSKLAELKLCQGFRGPDWRLIRPTLLLGLPIGLSTLMEIGFFGGMGLRIADIGVIEAGAHAVALNIAAFVFMFFISLGHAVTVRTSHAIGSGRYDDARGIVKLGLVSILAVACVSSLVTFGFRDSLPLLFNQDPEVVYLASVFLIFAALFQFFDGLQAMALCGLRAYKDTAVPSVIQFFAFWVVGTPLGFFLPIVEIGGEPIGSEGVWIAFCISLVVSCAFLLWRLYWVVFRGSAHGLQARAR